MALTGTQILAELTALPNSVARDARVLELVKAGNVPTWTRDDSWYWGHSEIAIPHHVLDYVVSPNFLEVGTDADPLLVPLTPWGAQSVADAYSSILPSRKLARQIYTQASIKLPLSDVKKPPESVPLSQIESETAVGAANRIDKRALAGKTPKGNLIAGHRKDIVVGPNLNGNRVAIFGGQYEDGKGGGPAGKVKPEDYWAVQPYSTVHGSTYEDYSHGVRLVFRRALLDGKDVDLVDVFQDPVLSLLVQDDGQTYIPRFPNTGSVKVPLPPASAGSLSSKLPAGKPPTPITSGVGTKTVLHRPSTNGGLPLLLGTVALGTVIVIASRK